VHGTKCSCTEQNVLVRAPNVLACKIPPDGQALLSDKLNLDQHIPVRNLNLKTIQAKVKKYEKIYLKNFKPTYLPSDIEKYHTK
jgi:hypothetical protein